MVFIVYNKRMKQSLNFLQEVGLSEKEILVYSTLLDYGSLPVNRLITLTKIKRGNLYNLLYALVAKRLIEEFEKDKKKHFRLNDPSSLRQYVVEERNKMRQATVKLDNIFPALLHEYQLGSVKPGVYYYDGAEGVRVTHDQILKQKNPVSIFVSAFERQNKEVATLIERQIIDQRKAGIQVKAITNHDYSKDDFERFKNYGTETRVVPNIAFESEIIIFGDTVSITTYKNTIFTTLIINKEIAQTLRTIFQSLWNLARDPQIIDKNN